jgi:putative nucleotidyltransferase with HDIG domain
VLIISNQDRDAIDQALSAGVNEILLRPVERERLSQTLDMLIKDTVDSTSEKIELKMRFHRVKREDIRPLVKRIQNLAPLPTLAHSILTIGNDPSSSAADLRNEIEKDQSLTARILKTVNSAYYGFHRKIGNVDRAIVILGFDEIINLTLAACIIEDYQSPDSNFDRQKFWIHSLGSAYIARELAQKLTSCDAKDAFVLGLLHDFGKVILDQRFKSLFEQILMVAREADTPLHEVEFEVANIDHAEIGGLVAESWRLPVPLVKAIQYHHNPDLSKGVHPQEIAIAHLANYYAHLHAIGNSGNPKPGKPHPSALLALGITESGLNEVWNSLNLKIDALRKLL